MEGIDWIKLEGHPNGAIRTCGSKLIAKFDGLNDVIKDCFNVHSIISSCS